MYRRRHSPKRLGLWSFATSCSGDKDEEESRSASRKTVSRSRIYLQIAELRYDTYIIWSGLQIHFLDWSALGNFRLPFLLHSPSCSTILQTVAVFSFFLSLPCCAGCCIGPGRKESHLPSLDKETRRVLSPCPKKSMYSLSCHSFLFLRALSFFLTKGMRILVYGLLCMTHVLPTIARQ